MPLEFRTQELNLKLELEIFQILLISFKNKKNETKLKIFKQFTKNGEI